MTLEEMKAQLDRANATGIAQTITAYAAKHGLDPAYALAIGSRETDLVNSIGDGGHGIGVMQVDTRFYGQAKKAKADGSWETNPEVLINLGCQILAENIAWAKEVWPSYTYSQWLKIAASAYNAGQGGAHAGVNVGDCDYHTTGGDYGKDVMARGELLIQLGL